MILVNCIVPILILWFHCFRIRNWRYRNKLLLHEPSKDDIECGVLPEGFSVDNLEIPANNEDGSSNALACHYPYQNQNCMVILIVIVK